MQYIIIYNARYNNKVGSLNIILWDRTVNMAWFVLNRPFLSESVCNLLKNPALIAAWPLFSNIYLDDCIVETYNIFIIVC